MASRDAGGEQPATLQPSTPQCHVPQAVPAWLQRTGLLLGADGIAKLKQTRVLLVGLGGVGSFAAEFLCRAGVGSMTIVDGDVVDESNKNRQLPALGSTVGVGKAQVMAARLLDINPKLELQVGAGLQLQLVCVPAHGQPLHLRSELHV